MGPRLAYPSAQWRPEPTEVSSMCLDLPQGSWHCWRHKPRAHKQGSELAGTFMELQRISRCQPNHPSQTSPWWWRFKTPSQICRHITRWASYHGPLWDKRPICGFLKYTMEKSIQLFFKVNLHLVIKTMHTWVKSLQLCPTLWDLMHRSPPSSSVRRISQAGVLEWVTISYSSKQNSI